MSVDLIYGCPGETLEDWRASLLAATRMRPDHISAYALVVEEGTRMGAQVARGELPAPDPDDEAAKYEEADAVLSAAGYRWYEISNFALVGPDEAGALDRGALAPTALARASRHNLAYWRDWDWWGLGPGAHSHIGALRWWNVKHPAAYASRLARGLSPAHSGEALDAPTRDLERVMLAVRTGEGVALADTPAGSGTVAGGRERVAGLVADGLIDAAQACAGRAVLTLRGRLLADHVTRELMGY